MRSQIIVACLLAVVAAVPAPSVKVVSRGCNYVHCAAALGPSVVVCVAAALQEELDPITDAACFASAANVGENQPSACAGCW